MAGHDWVKSTLGHGETMCSRCKITNREAAVLGVTDICDVEEEPSYGRAEHASKPKHRSRAVEAMASHLCTTDFTNGFCGPRDGKCQRRTAAERPDRDCMKVADGCMRAMESRGIQVVWPYDKE